MTADGLALVFHSRRGGGLGSGDLYWSRRQSVGQLWPLAVNMGPRINSKELDNAAFISPDGLLLAFSSERPGGLGAADLWFATRKSLSDDWGEPVNAGPSVNSAADDWAPRLSSDGFVMVFNSSQAGRPGRARPVAGQTRPLR